MPSINNQEVDYEGLNRIERLAIFLIAIGPDDASALIKHFEPHEIERVSREISKMQIVDQEMRELAVTEFMDLLKPSVTSVLGGMNFTRKALETSLGDNSADTMMARITPGGSTAEIIHSFKSMESIQIYNLLAHEQSQTVAFILGSVDLEKAQEILVNFPDEKLFEILEKMGEAGPAPVELLAKIAQSIKNNVTESEEYTLEGSGGIKTVAEILNVLDKEQGKAFLAKVGENNPELSAAISKKMFSFEDLVSLSVADMQRIAREVEMSDLVMSLKSCSKKLEEMIMGSVSKRAAESIKDELDMLGAVKVKEVDAAQDRIIQVVKRLEEEGAIDLGGDSGDMIE